MACLHETEDDVLSECGLSQQRFTDAEGPLSFLHPHDPNLAGEKDGRSLDAARGAVPFATIRRKAALQIVELARVVLCPGETDLCDYVSQHQHAEIESATSFPEAVHVARMSWKLKALFGRLEQARTAGCSTRSRSQRPFCGS